VPDESIDDLRQAGLFELIKPTRYGGDQLGFDALLEVAMALGQGCVSTAWVQAVFASHCYLLAQFPLAVQDMVYAEPGALVASVLRLGKVDATPMAGGLLIKSGEGRFCSGIDYASWVIAGAPISDGRLKFALLARSDVEIVDDWHTMGMKGTGSKSIHIPEILVPEERIVDFVDVMRGAAPGAVALGVPMYRTPFDIATSFALVGPTLGAALAALDSAAGASRDKVGRLPAEEANRQASVYARLGAASATVSAAIALMRADAYDLMSMVDPSALTDFDKARLHCNKSYAVQTCRRVVNELFEMTGGGSGLYSGSEIQQIWRDINGSSAHVAFTWDTTMAAYGRQQVSRSWDT
jgi:3-hydroxy-9,10-secoandrosta-1,3,5(10)-triene-9,17-dione monooxygenase